MNIIKDKNWKYKLAFDNDLYKEVKRFSFKLKPAERASLDFEIDFYRSFFSIEQILNVISKIRNADRVSRFKLAVEKRLNCLIYCPKQLFDYYKNLILTKHSANKDFLLPILKYANQKGLVVSPEVFYKNKFGKKLFAKVKKQCVKYSKRKIETAKQEKLIQKDIKDEVFKSLKLIETDKQTQLLWGKFKEPEFKIKFEENLILGEWNEQKTNYVGNEFIINPDYLKTKQDLEYLTYKSVFPGIAHFYNNTLIPKKTMSFDNGASYLINGWGNFAMWHVNPCTYLRNVKYKSCKIVSFMFDKKFGQKNIDLLYNYLLNTQTKNQAILTLIDLTQNIGKFESNVLGALAVEYLVDKLHLGPKGFLEKLTSENVGDFFESYLKIFK